MKPGNFRYFTMPVNYDKPKEMVSPKVEIDANYLSNNLKKAYQDAAKERIDEKYHPMFRALADLLMALNRQKGLHVKVKNVYTGDARWQYTKENTTDILKTKKHKNSPYIRVDLSVEHEGMKSFQHPYLKANENEFISKYTIYQSEDGHAYISKAVELSIHELRSHQIDQPEAITYVLDHVVAGLQRLMGSTVKEAQSFQIMNERFQEQGHAPRASASRSLQKPPQHKFKIR